MKHQEVDGCPDAQTVLGRLKPFQRRTVEYTFERLYRAGDSTHRFLVADEVGLGKTLVARGLIAKAIEHLWDGPHRVERIDIVYICSNTQIARQNIRRLQIGESEFVRADRLTLLPREIRNLKKNRLNYVALTPGTSFDLKSSLGRRDERVLLYHLLQRIWPDGHTGPKNLFQGWVSNPRAWRSELGALSPEQIDEDLADDFKDRVLAPEGDLPRQYRELCRRFRRFRDWYPDGDRQQQAAFVGRLRSLLAEVCANALEPDLVILDEFQRFKELLDGEDAMAELARKLFNYKDATSQVRVLLLSATPYRMYTLHHESHEDDHYQDFLRTIEFLDPRLRGSGRLRRLLDEYRQAMYRIDSGIGALERVKQEVEGELRRVMARTERLHSDSDPHGMLREEPCTGLELATGDVRDFVALARIGREVNQPQVLDYWKSAPYLLSFMDSYKLKTGVLDLLDGSSEHVLANLLTEGGRVSLSWEDVEAYARLDPANARLRCLLEWIERGAVWRLLWLPASLPYYVETGPWKTARDQGLSKRLIFSTWQVVPKAVASMVSYEVERRIFGGFNDSIRNTPEERRKRRPLLRFTRSRGRLTGMPVLGMLYPSPTLAELGDPLPAIGGEGILDNALDRARTRLEPLIERLTEPYLNGEREDEAWYWAAPILLDLERYAETTRTWFAHQDLASHWNGANEDDDEDSRWVDHVEEARHLVGGQVSEATRSPLQLGRPPPNLAEVLAARSVGGPATSALRALTRASGAETRAAIAARNAAARIAWSFRTLFNLPEAMALVRGERPGEDTPYWRQVVDYCVAGNLQAVLDEYVHTLRDLEGLFTVCDETAWEKLADAVETALALRTSVARVDELRSTGGSVRRRKHRLRNHFAMRFGAQESDDGTAGAREGQVRQAFNSPFWPFVLASTSVGQEGLDFHAYSHAVMHWNLPSNPVDLEQREGRVHRYKGHAIRKNVAARHGAAVLASGTTDVWDELFETARRQSSKGDGLVPYWLFPLQDGAYIERYVPALPLSRDTAQLSDLKRSLAVYRMVFGQPRQDDLMTFLQERCSPETLRDIEPLLRIDLSPKPEALP